MLKDSVQKGVNMHKLMGILAKRQKLLKRDKGIGKKWKTK